MAKPSSSTNIKNPARWLLALWGRLPSPGSVPNGNIIAGWAMAFKLEVGDPRIFGCLRAIDFMMRKAQQQILSIPFPETLKSRHLDWVHAYQHALSQTSSGKTWTDLYSGFSQERLVRMTDAADWLDAAYQSDAATQDDLDALVQSLSDLHKEISEAPGLEEDFRRLLLDMVEAMRRALAEYEIRGQSGVAEAMGDIMARVLARPELIANNSSSSWMKKVIDAAMKFIKIGADVKDTKEVLGGTVQFLLEQFK